ncbi:SNF2 family N-terminal domain-containing protein, partial [Coemansia spiralis]
MLLSGRDAVQNNAARLSFTTQPGFIKGGLLMDYQLTGVNWLLSRWIESKPAILADDMGMGKTIQVISFLSAIYHSTIPPDLKDMQAAISNAGTFPFLVIVPATLINNWMNEFKSWAPDLVVAQLSGRSAEREIQLKHTLFNSDDTHRKDLRCHVVLTSYEAISNLSGISVFAAHDFIWQAIILDEGHRLKNDQTKMYAILSRFKTRQRVLLTGTPLQNDVRELFSLVSFLDPDVFGNATSLHAKYSADTPEGIGQIKELIRPYILRRKKEDQLLLVPPKCELILPVSMTNLQRELYKATLSRNGGAAPPKPTKSTKLSSLTNILMEIRRIVSHPYLIRNVEPNFPDEVERHMRLIDSSGKLKLLHALLPELQARGHRILLFAQFKDTLDILEDYLAGEGVRYERIDGDTLPSVRQTKVDAFNSPSSSSLVFMASTRTGGLGLNLTSADVVVIYDCDFNPHIDLQAMARAHRIGQRKPVTVFKFVVKDSAEERIVKAATRKLVLEHLIIQ